MLLAAALTLCLAWPAAAPLYAAPSAAEVAADRARLDRALEELEAARREEARVAARIEEASAELDRIVADQEKTRERLRSRAVFMYRSGRESFLSVLLSAHSFEELATRWELLVRLNRQDEEDLRALEAARAALERTAEDLMSLQAQHARAVDALEERVARARQELSASETALKEYNARVAATASAARAAPKAATDVTQHLTGSGAWRTAVASHYARDFTGRGASGEEIGPYSMIVAHKTLPFGTLIEFEYGGRRAVARVADRGPYTSGREFDLGPGVVRVLDFHGVDEVRYRIISH